MLHTYFFKFYKSKTDGNSSILNMTSNNILVF